MDENIYVLGSGAVGLALAACLADAGRKVVAVRTSRDDIGAGEMMVAIHAGADRFLKIPVETISLARLGKVEGIIVMTAKAHANAAIAKMLADQGVAGPLVILQNGLGVEKPFAESRFAEIYRCVLYVTSQPLGENEIAFRPISSCPIGVVAGSESGLKRCVAALTTRGFPFRAEKNIRKEVWKKTIINSVFNSICPLLEADNGIFVRDENVANLAREIVRECLVLAEAHGLSLAEPELMEQLMRISRGSGGKLISTLQDMRNGRETEMEYLNLELARLAATMRPTIPLARTELLGNLIAAKSRGLRKGAASVP